MDAKNYYKNANQVYAYPRGATKDDQAFDGWQFLAMACSLNAVFFKVKNHKISTQRSNGVYGSAFSWHFRV